jgi:hypothetical protein
MYDLLKKEILNKYFLGNIEYIEIDSNKVFILLSNNQKLTYKIDDLLNYIKKKEGMEYGKK